MQLVDRVSTAGYSYVSPTINKACSVVPLLGKVKTRIEQYPPALIQKADVCIDTVVTRAEVAIRDTKQVIGQNALIMRAHKTTVAFVDTLDMLIDRYLPEPAAARSKDDEETVETSKPLIPRLLKAPFKIPVRMVHITVFKVTSGAEIVNVNIQWALKLTSDQKAKLQGLIRSRCSAIVDRASSSSLAVSLQQRKQGASKRVHAACASVAAGKNAMQVRCYKVCERLHIIEIKDYTLENVDLLQQSTAKRASDIVMAVSKRVYDVTAFVAGKERATGLFTGIGKRLPIVKKAIRSTSSTGTLSDSSSTDEDLNVDSSTGMSAQVSLASATKQD